MLEYVIYFSDTQAKELLSLEQDYTSVEETFAWIETNQIYHKKILFKNTAVSKHLKVLKWNNPKLQISILCKCGNISSSAGSNWRIAQNP